MQQGAPGSRSPDRTWDVSRGDVFTERATALYLPPDAALDDPGGDAASRPSSSRRRRRPAAAPAIVGPDDVQVNARGRANYAREVHNIFVDDPHVRRLMVGETFNPPGNWSSFPPHKHDGRDGEPCLEEVYYYRVDPPQGFGQQMLYTDRRRMRDALGARRRRGAPALRLSSGVAPPGYQLYYLWGDGRRAAQAGAARGSRASVDPLTAATS